MENKLKVEREKVKLIKDNPACFYSYAKTFSNTCSDIGPLINSSGEPVTDKLKMAEVLSDQYANMWSSSVFKFDPDNVDDVLSLDIDGEDMLTNVDITKELVKKALGRLSSTASPGPDGLPAVFLKLGGDFITDALTDIFRQSLETGEIPKVWKKAFIPPIWKGGDRSVPANYRPIALTSHCMKTMEHVLHPVLIPHLDRLGKLDEAQHGARAGRSTVSQLLDQHAALLHILEKGENAFIVYLDFSKAFDKVDLGS